MTMRHKGQKAICECRRYKPGAAAAEAAGEDAPSIEGFAAWESSKTQKKQKKELEDNNARVAQGLGATLKVAQLLRDKAPDAQALLQQLQQPVAATTTSAVQFPQPTALLPSFTPLPQPIMQPSAPTLPLGATVPQLQQISMGSSVLQGATVPQGIMYGASADPPSDPALQRLQQQQDLAQQQVMQQQLVSQQLLQQQVQQQQMLQETDNITNVPQLSAPQQSQELILQQPVKQQLQNPLALQPQRLPPSQQIPELPPQQQQLLQQQLVDPLMQQQSQLPQQRPHQLPLQQQQVPQMQLTVPPLQQPQTLAIHQQPLPFQRQPLQQQQALMQQEPQGLLQQIQQPAPVQQPQQQLPLLSSLAGGQAGDAANRAAAAVNAFMRGSKKGNSGKKNEVDWVDRIADSLLEQGNRTPAGAAVNRALDDFFAVAQRA